MENKKILFVVDTLAQHGAERYLYEMVKILLRHSFSVSICSILELDANASYYVKPMQDLGANIFVISTLPHPDVQPVLLKKVINSFSYRVIRKFDPSYISQKIDDKLASVLKKYDVVSIIKWEVYIRKPAVFDKLPKKKIHIMSALAQYADYPYATLPKGKTDFILMYPEQKKEILNGREDNGEYGFSTIPLLLDNEEWINQYSPKNDGVLRIGIFSRIHHDQPTIFSLYIIHELKSRNIPVVLHFFGRYYDEAFYKHYLKTAEILKIANEVKFMGHTEDIAEAIKSNNLNLGIMNAWDSFIGYSSIELQSHGLPVAFFNVTNTGYSNSNFPFTLNTISELCNTIEKLWQTSGKLEEVSKQAFSYAKNKFGSKHNVDTVIKSYTL
jgi:hypothetical protein